MVQLKFSTQQGLKFGCLFLNPLEVFWIISSWGSQNIRSDFGSFFGNKDKTEQQRIQPLLLAREVR